MDAVFKALADSSRRKLLDQLHMNSGQTLTQLSRELAMTRQGVSKHLAVLRRANLIIPLWRGREKLHYLNPIPLAQISERWIHKYEHSRVRALLELKKGLVENKPQSQ
jgi:DNA-binding transcriptional ArsR family regulator